MDDASARRVDNPVFECLSNRDFNLQASSPCRDNGRANALPPNIADVEFNNNVQEVLPRNLEFKLRFFGNEIDRDAYELQTATISG